jgi:uncharacterized protein
MKINVRKVILFIGITYGLTLMFHLLIPFAKDPKSFLGFAMVIPLLSVIIVQKFIFKKKIIPTLGFSIGQFQWYFIAMIIPIALSFNFNWTLEQFFKMMMIGVTLATFSALLEEVVWRGFLRQELNGISRIKAYFITALIWSIWHIPVAVFYRYTDDILFNTLLYCGQLFLFSLMINWLRDHSKSVFPASLFHGMLNVFYF